MYSLYIFCVVTLLMGTVSEAAVANLESSHVIYHQPQDALTPGHNDSDHDIRDSGALPVQHDDSDHDHDVDTHEVATSATSLNTTTVVLGNATAAMDNSTHGLEEDEDYPTVGHEVDENGCQLRIRNELERKCFSKFEDTVASSLHNDDAAESEKDVCCALEEYEKCCYRGYKATNCNTDKDSLKETLKAARIFLGAVTKNSCSSHRGQCAFSSTGNIGMSSVLLTCSAVLASIVALV